MGEIVAVAVLGMNALPPQISIAQKVMGVAIVDFRHRRADVEQGAIDHGTRPHHIVEGGEDAIEAFLAVGAGHLRPFPFPSFDRQGNDVGEVVGKVLFFHGPGSDRADMLVAQNSHGLSADANGHVESGGNSQGCEIALEILLGARIALNSIDRDRILGFDRPKIIGAIVFLHLIPLGIAIGGNFVEQAAVQFGFIFVIKPNAGTFDVQGARGDLDDFAQGLF